MKKSLIFVCTPDLRLMNSSVIISSITVSLFKIWAWPWTFKKICINFHFCLILAELLPTNNRFLLLTLFILIILIFLIYFPSPSLDCHMFPYSRPSWLTLGSYNRKVPLTAVGQQVGHHHLHHHHPHQSHPLQLWKVVILHINKTAFFLMTLHYSWRFNFFPTSVNPVDNIQQRNIFQDFWSTFGAVIHFTNHFLKLAISKFQFEGLNNSLVQWL